MFVVLLHIFFVVFSHPEWGWSLSWGNMGVLYQRMTEKILTPAPSWTSPSQVKEGEIEKQKRGEASDCSSNSLGNLLLACAVVKGERRQDNSRGVERMRRMAVEKKSETPFYSCVPTAQGQLSLPFVYLRPKQKCSLLQGWGKRRWGN